MKDYLYIPLGGNKVSPSKLYFNLWFVFLVSGLWHGASWNYVIWGAFHGFFLILDRLFLKKVLDKIGVIPSVLFTFFVVVIGWVFFSIEDLDHATQYLKVMFSFEGGLHRIITSEVIVTLILAAIFSFGGLIKPGKQVIDLLYTKEFRRISTQAVLTFASIILFILSLSSITAADFNPFIYFRF
jgi:alginate O-acetyltransferase complex protein AlgI